MRKAIFYIVLLIWPRLTLAQDKVEPHVQEGQFTFDTDKPFSMLELDQKEEPIVTTKKKPKRKVFYGVKTKKGFTRKGYGEHVTLELFYYLKKPEKPTNQFVRDVYWFSFKRREIMKTAAFDPKLGVLLHGPYKKMQDGVVLEEGIFFKGLKHGRWMRYNRQDLLEDKERYYKGWPKESIVKYYDPVEKKKVKEIIPIDFGEKEGYYYFYHENGQIAVRGEYQWDQKVNDWIEFYPNGKRKRILSYPRTPFEKGSSPYIKKEWDLKGEEIFSRL